MVKKPLNVEISLDRAIFLHQQAVLAIEKQMEALGQKTTLMWVPRGYDLRTTASAPKLKVVKREGKKEYFLNLAEIELVAILKQAVVDGKGKKRTYYLLSGGRIVSALYCAAPGEENNPLPNVGK
jgi:hypothetical protein